MDTLKIVLIMMHNHLQKINSLRLQERHCPCRTLSFLHVIIPGNEIGDGGASLLVEPVKEMQNLKKLNLSCESCLSHVHTSLPI